METFSLHPDMEFKDTIYTSATSIPTHCFPTDSIPGLQTFTSFLSTGHVVVIYSQF